MIQGIFLFLIILIAYSFFWFDFYFLKNNFKKFKEDFEKAILKNDVIVIFNSGGWGTVNYKKANDLNPFLKCIKSFLKKNNLKVSVIQYFRTEDHLIGKLGYLKDYASSFEKQAEEIVKIISRTKKRVILLGLSNGALIADQIMKKTNKKNVFSLELGKPFFGAGSKNKNTLLINDYEDDLSNGKKIALLKSIFIYAPTIWIKSFFLGENIPLSKAVRVRGHNYPLEKYKKRVIIFMKEKIL